jgi:hypothetical protein
MLQDLVAWLGIGANLIVILGVPVALVTYMRTVRKEAVDREYRTYDSLDERYLHFLEMCLERPYLDVFDVQDASPTQLSATQKKEEEVMFTLLFSIFERAYILYADQGKRFRRQQWTGWDAYIRDYCARQNFRRAWANSDGTWDTGFQTYMERVFRSIDPERNVNPQYSPNLPRS